MPCRRHCSPATGKPTCDKGTKTCVECLASQNCRDHSDPETPYCDKIEKICVDCLSTARKAPKCQLFCTTLSSLQPLTLQTARLWARATSAMGISTASMVCKGALHPYTLSLQNFPHMNSGVQNIRVVIWDILLDLEGVKRFGLKGGGTRGKIFTFGNRQQPIFQIFLP